MPDTRDLAYQDYLDGMKYKDIAKKYGVSLSAVKSWAARYWKKESCNPATKKVATKRKDQKIITEEVDQVMGNNGLTDKQRLFCLCYIRCFNATKAAIKAGYSTETAYSIGFENLKKPEIKAEIERLKQNRLNRELLSEDDLFQKYMDIAFSDMTDYASFGPGGVVLKDSGQVDGTLITEVKEGKAGVSVKLADRMQALKWLTDRYTSFNPEQQARIDKYKAETAKVEAENKERAGGEQPGDDGFLEALNDSAAEDWADED